MAFITDQITENVKKSSSRWRNFKNQEVLPPWWSGASTIIASVAALGLIGFVGYGFFNDEPVEEARVPAAVQNIDPFATEQPIVTAPSGGATTGSSTAPTETNLDDVSPSAQASAAPGKTGGYTNRTPASLKVLNSSMDATIPQGAVNLASDTAKAMVDGNWEGIPVVGETSAFPSLAGSEIDYNRVYLKEPVATGATNYKLVMDMRDTEGRETQLVLDVISANGMLMVQAPTS